MDIALEKKPPLPQLAQRPRHVHNITDRFSMANTYLIDDGRLIVVDPGSILNARLTLDYLERFLHRSPVEIDLIVLTHLHPEHTGGVEILRQVCHAPVAASAIARYLVRKLHGEVLYLSDERVSDINRLFAQAINQRSMPGVIHHLDLFGPGYLRQIQMVDLWLEDVSGLPGHLDWRVISSTGHTPESLCFYNPFSCELICGDTIATVEGGSILVRSGTNRHQLEETLRMLNSLNVYYLYPAHGRPILARRALSNAHIEW